MSELPALVEPARARRADERPDDTAPLVAWALASQETEFGSLAFRNSRAQLGVHRSTDSRDDLRHRLHVRLSGVEVHDAGAQHVAAADDGVGDERFAAALQPIEQFAVERVEMTFDLRLSDASFEDRAGT